MRTPRVSGPLEGWSPQVAEQLLVGGWVLSLDVVEVFVKSLGLDDEAAEAAVTPAGGFLPEDDVGAAVVAGELPALVGRGVFQVFQEGVDQEVPGVARAGLLLPAGELGESFPERV